MRSKKKNNIERWLILFEVDRVYPVLCDKFDFCWGCRDGAVVRALASHQCDPGFDSSTQRHMWGEFVGSLLCTERFSPGTPVSPLLKNQHLI